MAFHSLTLPHSPQGSCSFLVPTAVLTALWGPRSWRQQMGHWVPRCFFKLNCPQWLASGADGEIMGASVASGLAQWSCLPRQVAGNGRRGRRHPSRQKGFLIISCF